MNNKEKKFRLMSPTKRKEMVRYYEKQLLNERHGNVRSPLAFMVDTWERDLNTLNKLIKELDE